MTQSLFTLFPRALNFFYELSCCIVVVVFIFYQQCNDRNGEFKAIRKGSDLALRTAITTTDMVFSNKFALLLSDKIAQAHELLKNRNRSFKSWSTSKCQNDLMKSWWVFNFENPVYLTVSGRKVKNVQQWKF